MRKPDRARLDVIRRAAAFVGRRTAGSPRTHSSRRGQRTAASARRCTSRAVRGRRRPPRHCFPDGVGRPPGQEQSSCLGHARDRSAREAITPRRSDATIAFAHRPKAALLLCDVPLVGVRLTGPGICRRAGAFEGDEPIVDSGDQMDLAVAAGPRALFHGALTRASSGRHGGHGTDRSQGHRCPAAASGWGTSGLVTPFRAVTKPKVDDLRDLGDSLEPASASGGSVPDGDQRAHRRRQRDSVRRLNAAEVGRRRPDRQPTSRSRDATRASRGPCQGRSPDAACPGSGAGRRSPCCAAPRRGCRRRHGHQGARRWRRFEACALDYICARTRPTFSVGSSCIHKAAPAVVTHPEARPRP
jgi:hypothetical protein